MGGLATGALVGLLLQLWLIASRDCCGGVLTAGQAILGGFGVGLVCAAFVAFLAALHARRYFWDLFPPLLVVVVLSAIAVALLSPALVPPSAIVVLAPLLGYLIGLLFCSLCRRAGFDPKGVQR